MLTLSMSEEPRFQSFMQYCRCICKVTSSNCESVYFSSIVSYVASLFAENSVWDWNVGLWRVEAGVCTWQRGMLRCSARWSPPDPNIANIHYVHSAHRTLLSRPGDRAWRLERLRMLTRAASREQWTLHLVVTLDLNTLYLQLTTENSRKQGRGLTLTALGLKIQVIEFLGGQCKIRRVTSDNEWQQIKR